MKITVEQFNLFIDTLSNDWYLDGSDDIVDPILNGEMDDPNEQIIIERDDISIIWQGVGQPPGGNCELDFLDEFKKWMKRSDETPAKNFVKKYNCNTCKFTMTCAWSHVAFDVFPLYVCERYQQNEKIKVDEV